MKRDNLPEGYVLGFPCLCFFHQFYVLAKFSVPKSIILENDCFV